MMNITMNIHYNEYYKLQEENRICNTFQTLTRFVIAVNDPVLKHGGPEILELSLESCKMYARAHTRALRKESKVSIPRHSQRLGLNGGLVIVLFSLLARISYHVYFL